MSHSITANDKERLEARISKDKKKLLKRAAALSHNSLTDFIIHTLVEKANKIIKEHKTLELSEQDSKVFVENLMSPSKIGNDLRSAIKKYKNNKFE